MYDVITIGSAVMDIFIESSTFDIEKHNDQLFLCQVYGEKNEVDSFEIRTGGGGGNTAVGFARMGFKTGVITETGRDVLADLLTNDFHKEYVATNLIIQEKKEQTGGSIILLGKDGKRSILVYRGAASLLDPSDIPVDRLEDAKWVHIASIAGRAQTLKKIFHARKKQRKVSWNPGSSELQLINQGEIEFSEIPCDVLQMNADEWKKIEQFQKNALAHIPYIVVTDGSDGGTIYQKNIEPHIYGSHSAQVVDSTGAGDAFLVGFVSALIKEESVAVAAEWGAKNAASVVKYMGAKPGLLSNHEIA